MNILKEIKRKIWLHKNVEGLDLTNKCQLKIMEVQRKEIMRLNKLLDKNNIISRYNIDVPRTMPKELSYTDLINNICFGLSGETGEIMDYLKKVRFQGHVLDEKKLSEEVGDLFWYLFALMQLYGLKIEDVLIQNMNKRLKRYPNGFSSKNSVNRMDVEKDHE